MQLELAVATVFLQRRAAQRRGPKATGRGGSGFSAVAPFGGDSKDVTAVFPDCRFTE